MKKEAPTLHSRIKTARILLLIVGVAIGVVVTGDLVHQAQAEEGKQAVSAAGASENYPLGRKPVAIVDGQYPDSLRWRAGRSGSILSLAEYAPEQGEQGQQDPH